MSIVSLLFHDVVDPPAESGFAGAIADGYKLGVEAFDAHLDAALAAQSWGVRLVASRAAAAISGMALTFDDGGESYATEIAPRLEDRGVRGHCFVTTGRIGSPGFLSRDQIRDLDRRGHVIGSHSASHPTRFSACERREMEQEWRVSCDVLADILGHAVTVASLPGGYYSRTVGRAAAACGIEVLFTSEPTIGETSVDDCLLLGRFAIRRTSQPERTRALVGARRTAIWREQTVWQAKKVLKALSGSTYPQICAWIGTRRAVPSIDSRD
jgi:peptidoglycan/xylan/chitin deacetylase (PgdA/CDA1 family)